MSKSGSGYKRPPVHTRFKKGQSGNPKGRPKRSLNLITELKKELTETVAMREGGRGLKVPKARALVKQLVARALTGDVRAAFTIMKLSAGMDPSDPDTTRFAAEDEEIIRDFLRRHGGGA